MPISEWVQIDSVSIPYSDIVRLNNLEKLTENLFIAYLYIFIKVKNYIYNPISLYLLRKSLAYIAYKL